MIEWWGTNDALSDAAELAAISAVRTVVEMAETGKATITEFETIVESLEDRFEQTEVTVALAYALAKHAAAAQIAIAQVRGVDVSEHIDAFEMRKLAQIDRDLEEGT